MRTKIPGWRAALIAVTLPLSAYSLPPPPEIHPPLPVGQREVIGACVYAAGTPYERICEWSISIRTDADGKPLLVVASRQLPPQSRVPRWTVYDRLPHPSLRKDESVAVALCQRDGVDDQFIVAVVREAEDRQWLEAIRWAARFDTAQGRFSPIDVAGVRCINEAYGL